jgi:hypothetical protein
VSELLDVRVIGTPQTTTQAVFRLPALFEVDHQHGPYPSRKTPGRVRYYLTARLRPGWIDQAPLAQIEDRKAARDPRGHAPDCPAALRGRPPYGATFLAVAWPRSGGEVRFRVVSSTAPDDATPRGGYAIEDLWFAWPAISLVRAGTIFLPPRRGVRP